MKKIVLGTAQFTGKYGITKIKKKFTEKDSHKILKTLISKRLRHLDISIDYKNSLEKLSKFNFKNWHITTKINPQNLNFSNEQKLLQSIEDQINLIKQISSIKKINNLLIRNSNIMLTPKGKIFFRVLNKIKKKKLITNFGYSIYDFKTLDKLINKYKPDIIQCPYNVFDRRIENIKITKLIKKKKIKIQARSIFLQGILLKKVNQLPKFFQKWKRFFLDFEDILKINKLSALSLCFNFVNNNSDINEILIGVQNNRELKEILEINLRKKILMKKKLFKPSIRLIDPRKWPKK